MDASGGGGGGGVGTKRARPSEDAGVRTLAPAAPRQSVPSAVTALEGQLLSMLVAAAGGAAFDPADVVALSWPRVEVADLGDDDVHLTALAAASNHLRGVACVGLSELVAEMRKRLPATSHPLLQRLAHVFARLSALHVDLPASGLATGIDAASRLRSALHPVAAVVRRWDELMAGGMALGDAMEALGDDAKQEEVRG
jgi:hypothetical protein